MKKVQVGQGGEIVGFPDTMTDAEILAQLRKNFMKVAEPAAAITTGAVAEPISGLAGLGVLGLGGNADQAADKVRAVQEWMTYVPRTEEGQKGLQAVADILQPVADAMEWTSKSAGDYVFEKTGSEELAAIAYAAPTAALEAIGLKVGAVPLKAAGLDMDLELGDIGTSNKQAGAIGGIKRPEDSEPTDAQKLGGTVGGDDPASGFQKIEKITKEMPILDPRELEGKTIKMSLADLTDAGRAFDGVEGVETFPIALEGGIKFPLLERFADENVVWAAQDEGAISKLQDGDVVMITAMTPESHKSNATVATSFLVTFGEFINQGKISPENAKKFIDKIEGLGKFKGDKSNPHREFPEDMSAESLYKWAKSLTFDQRKDLANEAMKKESKALGIPSMERILDATVDPDYAGYDKGNVVFAIEVTKGQEGRVDFKKEGIEPHMSYDKGVRGRVLGALPQPVPMQELLPDFMKRRRQEGGLPQYDYRAIQVGQPKQMVTPDLVSKIPTETLAVKSPRQAQVIQSFLDDDWRDAKTAKKDGGVSPQEFYDAVQRNKYAKSLDVESPKDIQNSIKSGKLDLFRLGDKSIYFGIRNAHDYNKAYGVDLEKHGLSPSEKVLTGVVSNEIGAPSTAVPSVMFKALEEGVTALDAFSVPSKKHPEGFLPAVYGKYGFEEVARVPFNKEFYLEDHTELDLQELMQSWQQDGWTPEFGMPDVVIMKWRGKDSDRINLKQRWLDNLNQSGDNFGDGGEIASEAGSTAGATNIRDGQQARARKRDSGDDFRAVRDGYGIPTTGRFADAVRAVSKFDNDAKRRYGIESRTDAEIEYDKQVTPEHQAASEARAERIRKRRGVRGKNWVLPEQSGSASQFSRDQKGRLNGIPEIKGFDVEADEKIADVAAKYMERVGQTKYSPPKTYVKPDPKKGAEIAQLYEEMEHRPNDPEVKEAYQALIDETLEQYEQILRTGFKAEFIDFDKMGDPYKETPRLAIKDIRENNHMYVFSTRDGFGSEDSFDPQDNPLLQETDYIISGQKALANDIFRVVHDYFGHAKEGLGFRAGGEENAWRSHAAMYSPLARRALTTETRGQNSWVNFGKHGEFNRSASAEETIYADQKTGLLPLWVSESFGDVDATKKSIPKRKFNYTIE